MSIPTTEPTSFAAGDSLSWTKSLADYLPASGWSLIYCFRGKDLVALDVTSTTSGTDHLVSISTTDSAGLIAGIYSVAGYAAKTGERVQIFKGQINVTLDLQSVASGQDTRTQARRTLDNINAVIEGRASSAILDSTVNGTNLRRIPVDDLLKLRDRFAVIVAAEEQAELSAQGKPSNRNIYARFIAP